MIRPTLGPSDVPSLAAGSALVWRSRMSARATSFYYSFLVLPAPKRSAIVAVWDFCRAVDDAVDEPDDPNLAGRWRGGAMRSCACTRAASRDHQGRRCCPSSALQAAAVGVRGSDRRRGNGSRAAALRDVRRAAAVLSPRRLGGGADLRGDLRLSRRPGPRLRHRPRHRAAAHKHHPRCVDRSRAGPLYIPSRI